MHVQWESGPECFGAGLRGRHFALEVFGAVRGVRIVVAADQHALVEDTVVL